jgi:6,7-dimethyl-8-ribityllumazine synthase
VAQSADGAPHILLVVARFYEDIADAMIAGARAELERAGATFEIVGVAGAFEIPAAIGFAHRGGEFDGYVGLGCVIRGETSHYDYVCGESARGLNMLAIDHGAAIGYGILTTENHQQAWARAAVDQGNKGAYAARACLDLVALRRRFGDRT